MYTQKVNYGMTEEYFGLSTDTKPSQADNGDLLTEMDTGKKFRFDEENGTWYEQPSEGSGGGSGGGGGESDVFIITMSPTGNGLTCHVDKTPSEAIAAYEAGKTIKIKREAGSYDPPAVFTVANLYFHLPTECMFVCPWLTLGYMGGWGTGYIQLDFNPQDQGAFISYIEKGANGTTTYSVI